MQSEIILRLGDRDLEACSSIFIFVHCLPLFDSLLDLSDDVTSMTTEEPLFRVHPAGNDVRVCGLQVVTPKTRFNCE